MILKIFNFYSGICRRIPFSAKKSGSEKNYYNHIYPKYSVRQTAFDQGLHFLPPSHTFLHTRPDSTLV